MKHIHPKIKPTADKMRHHDSLLQARCNDDID